MSTEGAVYDLGYTPHKGERLGRGGAVRAIFIDGVRRSLGLRRKPWAKVLPWSLIAAAIVPAGWFVALTFFLGGFDVEDLGPFASPSQLFEIIGTMAMLFLALVVPTLLIPDRRHGVLSMYASRPVRAGDYLIARVAVIAFLATLFILIPQLTMYVGVSALNENGVWAGITTNAEELLPILGTTIAFVIGYGAPAVLVSLYVGRVPIASGVYVVAMFMTGALADALPLVSEILIFQVLAPMSLFFNPMSVRDWLFDDEGPGMILARVGLPQWVGAVAILVVAVITGVLALREYRKHI